MSGAFQVIGGTVEDIAFKLTVNTPVVIAGDAKSAVRVYWFQCTEIAGSTPTLSVEKYDGTLSYYLRHAVALAANGSYFFDAGLWLPPGSFLRVTAGTANQIDVVGLKSLAGVTG